MLKFARVARNLRVQLQRNTQLSTQNKTYGLSTQRARVSAQICFSPIVELSWLHQSLQMGKIDQDSNSFTTVENILLDCAAGMAWVIGVPLSVYCTYKWYKYKHRFYFKIRRPFLTMLTLIFVVLGTCSLKQKKNKKKNKYFYNKQKNKKMSLCVCVCECLCMLLALVDSFYSFWFFDVSKTYSIHYSFIPFLFVNLFHCKLGIVCHIFYTHMAIIFWFYGCCC